MTSERRLVRDRRSKRCQHCYRWVRAAAVPDGRVFDSSGSPECRPGLAHKVMPEVGS